MTTVAREPHSILQANQLEKLIEAVSRQGYEILGPTVRDGAIVYDRLESASELPAGWTDEQAPGRYRLQRRDDQAAFGYSVGPQSWKRAWWLGLRKKQRGSVSRQFATTTRAFPAPHTF